MPTSIALSAPTALPIVGSTFSATYRLWRQSKATKVTFEVSDIKYYRQPGTVTFDLMDARTGEHVLTVHVPVVTVDAYGPSIVGLTVADVAATIA